MLDTRRLAAFSADRPQQRLSPGDQSDMNSRRRYLARELLADAGRRTSDDGPWTEPSLINLHSHIGLQGAPGRAPANFGQDQLLLPPSTLRTCPVMNEASSDAIKTMALATSYDRPRRSIGTVVTRAALFSGVCVKRVNIPVSIGPGATPFTRIPDLTVSSATDLVSPSTACLLPT